MLGHKWESAQGTIIQAQTGPPSGQGTATAMHPVHEYLIEVRKPSGELIRGTVTEKSMFQYPVGSTIGVEVHSKTNEIRFDPSARVDSIRGMVHMAQQMRGAAAAGTVMGVTGLGGPGQVHIAGESMHVIGPGGQQVPVTGTQGEEIRSLVQAMMAGDPAAKQAAAARIRELKDQLRQQAMDRQDHQPGSAGATGAPRPTEGFSGSPGPVGFNDLGSPRSPGSQGSSGSTGGSGGYGAFGEPAAFGQPAAFGPTGGSGQPGPDPFGTGGAATSSFGSFDTGAGQGSRDQRLGRLKQLLDKGILTESEYETQRQQVLNGF